MEEIIKSYLSIFFIALLTLLGICMIYNALIVRQANLFFASCRSRIEASNMAESVIADCIAEAEEFYPAMTFMRYGSGDYSYGRLDLEYRLSLPILNLNSTHHITSEIR